MKTMKGSKNIAARLQPEPMAKKKRSFFSVSNKSFLAVLAGLFSFLLYCNTIPNFYNLDDELITENHILTDYSFSTFQKIFTEPYYKDVSGNKYEYRPVVLLCYFFEFLIFGRNPHVSHFFNVILYAVTCVLLFYLLAQLFRDATAGTPVPAGKKPPEPALGMIRRMPTPFFIALAVTLLFAAHTVHTEVVASIKNRDEILALLFGLMSWHFALKFIDSKHIGSYLLYLLFFVIGIFSKQTSITFAILIPVSVIMFRNVSLQTLVTVILPVQLVSAIFSPVYLIYKKVVMFMAQIFFLVVLFYFISRRQELTAFFVKIFRRIASFFAAIGFAVIRYFRAYSISVSEGIIQLRASIKVLLGTVLALAVVIGTVGFLTKKKKEVKQVQWTVTDALHDFNELRLTTAMQTPAPAVVPTAGRALNYVEIPLLFEEKNSVKAATSLLVLRVYLRLMIYPTKLKYYYGYGLIPMADFKHFLVWVAMMIHLPLVIPMIYFLTVRRHFIAAFGFLYYLLAIIPLSNLLTPIAGVMAERLVYTPSLGFCIAAGYLLVYPCIFTGDKFFGVTAARMARFALTVFIMILLVLSAMTVSRNFLWKDHLTLMRHDIVFMNKSARGHHLLASHLAERARETMQRNPAESRKLLQEAVVHFKKTIENYPEYPYVWHDLAKVYMMQDDIKNAIDAYRRATDADSTYATAPLELGIVLEQTGNVKEAEEAYKQALARDTLLLQAYINLSYLYYKEGRYNESIGVNLSAVRRLPRAYEPYENLGKTYLMLNDVNTALAYFEQAAALNRSNTGLLNMMAELYESMGNMEKARYYRTLK